MTQSIKKYVKISKDDSIPTSINMLKVKWAKDKSDDGTDNATSNAYYLDESNNKCEVSNYNDIEENTTVNYSAIDDSCNDNDKDYDGNYYVPKDEYKTLLVVNRFKASIVVHHY